MKEEILNQGLSLALAWGKDWLQPIQERLAALHPELSQEELEDYNKICREAMFAGFKLAETASASDLQMEGWNRGSDTHQSTITSPFKTQMLSQYPWVNNDNLSRLFSQGVYYAMK